MTRKKFVKRPVTFEAFTFDQFINYGITEGGKMEDGKPKSFIFFGNQVLKEKDGKYFIVCGVHTHYIEESNVIIVSEHGKVEILDQETFRVHYKEYIEWKNL